MKIAKKIFLLVMFSIFSLSSIISGELSELDQLKQIDKEEESILEGYKKEINKEIDKNETNKS